MDKPIMTIRVPRAIYRDQWTIRYPSCCQAHSCGKIASDPGGCDNGCPLAGILADFNAAVMASGATCNDEIWSPTFYSVSSEAPVRFAVRD